MIRDRLKSTIDKALTPAAITALSKAMVAYVDRNSDLLMTLDLSRRFSFADEDRAVVYNAIGVTEAMMVELISQSKDINKTNKKHSNPFYVASMITMAALLEKKKEKEARMLMTYMSLMMYTSIHKGFFEYSPNKQIMDYTISHLDNSFRIRTMTSLYVFLDDNAQTAFDTYKNRIIRCADKDITWVVDALHTRVKQKVKKIASAFYENYKSGNYLNTDTDSSNPDDYHEIDNTSFMIERLTNKIYLRLLNHQFDNRFIKYAITRSDVSYQKLKNLIDDSIMDDETNSARKVISSLIEYYLSSSGRGFEYIAKGDFITYMKAAYASNTESPQMAYIKTTLDTWLNEHSVSIGRQNYGKTAQLGYKKGLYMFFVFLINYEAKVG